MNVTKNLFQAPFLFLLKASKPFLRRSPYALALKLGENTEPIEIYFYCLYQFDHSGLSLLMKT